MAWVRAQARRLSRLLRSLRMCAGLVVVRKMSSFFLCTRTAICPAALDLGGEFPNFLEPRLVWMQCSAPPTSSGHDHRPSVNPGPAGSTEQDEQAGQAAAHARAAGDPALADVAPAGRGCARRARPLPPRYQGFGDPGLQLQ